VSGFKTSCGRLAPTAFLVLLTMGAAVAQSITDADIERAKQSQPIVTEQDIARARERNRMPTEAALRGVPVPSTPRIDRLPQPRSATRPDLESIARGYQAANAAASPGDALGSGPSLLVFVSFAMPQPTLERLVDQAARARASLILRGFVNGSLQETVLRVQRLIGQREVAVQIDPQAFDRFSIANTPAFVLVRDGATATPCFAGQCFAANAFVRTAGDVSLDYALEFIDRSAPAFGPAAQAFLSRMKGR